jgi:hypothetical protein
MALLGDKGVDADGLVVEEVSDGTLRPTIHDWNWEVSKPIIGSSKLAGIVVWRDYSAWPGVAC